MFAVFKKELRGYFISPVGYVFMAVFFLASALLVSFYNLSASTTDVSYYYTMVIYLFVVLIPLLTMRLLSEERKTKTEQILLTSPVSLPGILFGKFLSAFVLFGSTLVISMLNFIPLYLKGTPNTAKILSLTLGTLLIGAAFISIGLFISALTENQLSSAILSIAVILGMVILGLVSTSITNTALRTVVKWISIFDRFGSFSKGVLDFSSLLYYCSIVFVFMFLTVRVYEKRRWE